MQRREPLHPEATVWLTASPVLAAFALSNAPTPLYLLWRDQIGFSAGTQTVIFGCYIAGLLGTLVLAGRASDRIGRRRVVLPGMAVGVLACGIFAVADSAPELAVGRFLTGIAVGIAVSAGMAAVVDVAGPRRLALGALAASTAMVLGAGTGPLAAGLLAAGLGDPTVAVFAAEAALLAAAAFVLARLPLPVAERAPGSWVRFPSVPSSGRRALLLGVAVFGPGITATSFMLSLGPSVLAETAGGRGGLAIGAIAFVMFLSAALAQALMRRVGPRQTLLAGAGATAGAMLALGLAVEAQWTLALLLAGVLAGGGQGLGQLAGLTMLAESVPRPRRAEANAALSVGAYVPAGLLPVATGYLADAMGLDGATIVFASVLLGLAAAGGLLAVGVRAGGGAAAAVEAVATAGDS